MLELRQEGQIILEWHDEDLIEIHPHDAEDRGINEQDWVGINSRAGDTVLRAKITDRVQPGVVYTTFSIIQYQVQM